MADGKIEVGTLIRFNNEETTWRVILLHNGVYRMIDTKAQGFVFKDMSYDEMIEAELNGTISVAEDQEIHVLDKSKLSEMDLEVFRKKQAFVNDMDAVYGPDFSIFPTKAPKPLYKEKLEEYGFSKANGLKILLSWLQCGKQEYALADKRLSKKNGGTDYHYNVKTGRKSSRVQGVIIDEYCKEAFEYGLQIFKRYRTASVVYCFVKLTGKYYSREIDGKLELFEPDKRPTEKQFRNYINKILSPEENAIIKTSLIEYRNNKRILFGTSRFEATRPGMLLEADAVETDLYVVSAIDPTKLVGRPVIYMMVDIYSHCIVAASVGFENNSELGLTNLLINFFLDKGRVACDSNVIIDESLWPSQFIPGTIRCDRGSDFKSKKFEDICASFGISRQLCTGATGSMKGTIEQLFREFHLMFATEFERKGYIQKRYDSNHKKEALLTIDEVSQLVILFILYHNSHNIMSTQLTKDMIKEGVSKKPIDIWNYGIKHNGSMPPIVASKADEAFYNLLPASKAGISRGGILFKDLYYLPFGDNDLLAKVKLSTVNAGMRDSTGKMKNSLEIRFDPRSVNYLYYIKDGRVMKLSLNKEKCGSYINMTWNEYSDYYRIQHDRDIELGDENLRLLVERDRALESISKNATKAIGIPDGKNMRETRRVEKDRVNFKGAVSNYIEGSNWDRDDSKLFNKPHNSITDILLGNEETQPKSFKGTDSDGAPVTEGESAEMIEVPASADSSTDSSDSTVNLTGEENVHESATTAGECKIALLSDDVPEVFKRRRRNKL